MAENGTDPAARLRVGATLAHALAFCVRHAPGLALLAGTLYLPLFFFDLEVARRHPTPASGLDSVGEVVLRILLLTLPQLFLQVFLTLAVLRHRRGERARLIPSIGRGLPLVPRTFGVAGLFAILLVGALFVAGIPLAMLRESLGETETARWLGGLLLALALAWAVGRSFVAPQVLVVEGLGPWDAMVRGRRLAEPSRGQITVLVVLLVLTWWGGLQLVSRVLPDRAWTWEEQRVAIGLHAGVTALVAVCAAVCAAVAYHDVRYAREGVSLDDLIRVFE